jgi:arsenate reductase
MARVLILCTGNSARSQISEGLFRHLAGDNVDVHSAGTHPAGMIHPLAVKAMNERGIDISSQWSKSIDQYMGEAFDYVITVCDEARRECPVFPGAKKQLHWSTPDPSYAPGTEEDRLEAFRKTVALLEERIRSLLQDIQAHNPT